VTALDHKRLIAKERRHGRGDSAGRETLYYLIGALVVQFGANHFRCDVVTIPLDLDQNAPVYYLVNIGGWQRMLGLSANFVLDRGKHGSLWLFGYVFLAGRCHRAGAAGGVQRLRASPPRPGSPQQDILLCALRPGARPLALQRPRREPGREPLRPVDPGLPDYEVTFIVEDAADAACPAIRRAMAACPQTPARLLVAGRATDCGQKVHNLRAATAELPPEIRHLVFFDSDSRPKPYFVRAAIYKFYVPRIGATTGYRWLIPQRPNRSQSSGRGDQLQRDGLAGSPIASYRLGRSVGHSTRDV